MIGGWEEGVEELVPVLKDFLVPKVVTAVMAFEGVAARASLKGDNDG